MENEPKHGPETEKQLEDIPSIGELKEILEKHDWDKIERLQKATLELHQILIGLEDNASSVRRMMDGGTDFLEPGKIESQAEWIISNLKGIEDGIKEILQKMPGGKLQY